jgi:hypothetical protein
VPRICNDLVTPHAVPEGGTRKNKIQRLRALLHGMRDFVKRSNIGLPLRIRPGDFLPVGSHDFFELSRGVFYPQIVNSYMMISFVIPGVFTGRVGAMADEMACRRSAG